MANNVVGQVSVTVVPDGSQFGPNLQSMLNKASANAQINVGNSINATQQLGQAIDQNIGQKFAAAAMQAGAFTAAVMGSKAIVEGMVGKLAGLFDQLAQAQAGFNSIIGERKGTALLDEIRQFAKESPFVTQQLVMYGQQLLGVGMASEKIVPLLKDTGNVIASVGGDTQNLSRVLYAFSQIKSMGRLMGQDAMQLQSALIPIWKLLSESLGKTVAEVRKMSEQGRISADMAFEAIQKAGQKVPGAMDNAVRNIAGARSVLSDTITNMFQDSTDLRNIFDDLVRGIGKFAAKLDSPEVKDQIHSAFSQIGTVYEELKPTIISLLETLGSGSLTGLSAFSSTLELLANVLNSIPQPVMNALAKFLAAITMLKAPMMLMSYVKQLQTMASVFTISGSKGIIGGLTGMLGVTKANTQAAVQAAIADTQRVIALKQLQGQVISTTMAIDMMNQATWAAQTGGAPQSKFKKFVENGMGRMVASAGLTMGGQWLANRKGNLNLGVGTLSEAQTKALGTMATYAGYGTMIGGPVGTVVGGAVGAVKGILDAGKEAREKRKQAEQKQGAEWSTDILTRTEDKYGSGVSGATGTVIQRSIDAQERILARAETQRDAAIKAALEIDNFELQAAALAAASSQYTDVENRYTGAKQELDIANTPYVEITEGTKRALAGLSGPALEMAQASFTTGGTSGYLPTRTMKDIIGLEEAWASYGLTLEEVGQTTDEERNRIITAYAAMSEASRNAAGDAAYFNNIFDKQKQTAEGLYGAVGKQAANQLQYYSAMKSAADAASKAFDNQGDKVTQLQLTQAEAAAQQAAYTAAASAEQFRLEHLYGMERTKAEAIANEAGIRAAEAVRRQITVVSKTTVDEMAKTYGYSKDQLQEILGLTGAISGNYKVTITVEIQEAVNKLKMFQDALLKLNLLPSDTPEIELYKSASQYQIDQQQKIIQDAIDLQQGGQTSGGGGGGGGQSFADKIKSAAGSLEGAIKSAMAAAEDAAAAWKSTVKERTQYEQAVSPSRIISNARQQAQDIAFMQTSISTLKARGLTEAAISALDINALTDVKQVKKLLASDPSQLTELSAAIARRDELASTLSSDRMQEQSRKTITQAIIEAAKLLGYTTTPEQAAQIAAQFNITTATDAEAVGRSILNVLSGAKIAP